MKAKEKSSRHSLRMQLNARKLTPILGIALATKNMAKVERCGVPEKVRTNYTGNVEDTYLIIPMCLMDKDGVGYHWVVLALVKGKWIVYNSARRNTDYKWQYMVMIVPLTQWLNEMGHRDPETGGNIDTNFSHCTAA
ncbi:hypothetical protein C5167_021997 [Papaver somniferum]|uniref:Uncharacterized protein n=1 Tax=Papaver somniferum TaxID=3469 RepID=A0A4Y7JI64_PAPSO|nr:hypothetical protein C5167_021997 [Papaver somniferum]